QEALRGFREIFVSGRSEAYVNRFETQRWAVAKAEADQRRQQLLARQDIINALIDVATGLAPEGEWIKVEVIKKFLLQEYPGLEANAPRYAKFYRMLEDTGCFEVQLQGSTVMAKLKPQPEGKAAAAAPKA
ncbi:MAG: hypothetical protein RL492_509, partial [Verrucomicrobiota bacterium]